MGAGVGQQQVLGGATFDELRKSPKQIQGKLQRDLAILKEETRAQPDNPRWWYYLGQTREDLGDPAQAVEAYRQCAALDGWAEQAAWACYKGASCLSQIGDFQAAIEMAALGLTKLPASPELAWLAGFCAYRWGHYAEAICWARMSIALGHVEGMHAGNGRISFRHLPGWYEAPYDVLRCAYQKLEQPREAEEAKQKFDVALRLRSQMSM